MLTLAIFSFLYGDNPFYKVAEALLVGVSAAYWMVVAFWDVLVPNLMGKLWPSLVQAARRSVEPIESRERSTRRGEGEADEYEDEDACVQRAPLTLRTSAANHASRGTRQRG